jgi:hypothetical protein
MEKSQKVAAKFYCKSCDYTTSRRSDISKHLETRKHLSNVSAMVSNEKSQKVAKSRQELISTEQEATGKKQYICDVCDKVYCDNSGLWRHKKSCVGETKETPNHSIPTEMVIELIKQNKELQELLIQEMRKSNNNTNNNIMTNSHNNNKTFNINMFLNDRCKNAMNIMDFVNSLDVTTKDLERTGQVGFVNGITSIIMDGLRGLDMYTRPIHCTDLKRETVYVKDENIWKKDEDKDGEEKPIFRMAVKRVASKNLRQLTQWKLENPECEDGMSKASDDFVTISQTALGGITKDDDEKYQNNIMRNVLKKVTIDKANMLT